MAAVTTGLARPRAVPARGRRDDLAGTIRSELTKIRSVRSTYWTLFLLVLASIGWSIANCAGEAANWAQMVPQDKLNFDATQPTVLGLAMLGQLIIVVLGALTITSEYSTGMIRTSLTVMPRRGVLYAAKAAVFGAIALIITVLTSFASFFTGEALLRSTHESVTLSQPNVLRAVFVTALYVALCGLFALGLGAILRNTAGTITAAYGFLFLLPQLARALPHSWYVDIERWLPGGQVINAITTTSGQQYPNLFSAWGELAVFGAYTVIAGVLGVVLFRKRDA